MVKNTIYIDIDSTIWPAEVGYMKALETSGIQGFDIHNLYQDDTPGIAELFIGTLTPKSVEFRDFYPGVVETLNNLYERGYWIEFISHHPEPEKMYDAVADWLWNNIIYSFQLAIFPDTVCKVERMLEFNNAKCLIEDKPSTLKKAANNGITTFGFVQPWNLETIREDSRIVGFTHWDHIDSLIHNSIGVK